MKKIVFLSLLALCLPWTLAAQSVEDDLYYVPSKKKAEQKTEQTGEQTVRKAPENVVVVETQKPVVCTNSGNTTTIVVKDKKGNVRDVDEYNRRYNSKEYDFTQNEDTLYIEEKAVPDPEGEWVGGFDGSQDDYEYAMRLIRFRNPRYAISISSPLYWDVVYGLNSWDWNVYTDGLYAYAFPTFTNRLWWDWRYNSYGWGLGWPYYGWNWGWGGWYSGWYGGWYAGWGGWYGGWGWGWPYYHYPHYYPGWHHPGPGHWASRDTYTTRRSSGRSVYRNGTVVSNQGSVRSTNGRVSGTTSYRSGNQNGTTTVRRVVGSRSTTTRNDASAGTPSTYSRRNTGAYTRPSSTRVGSSSEAGRTGGTSTYTRGSGLRSSGATYSRGSSNSVRTRSYSPMNNNNNNESRRSNFNSSTRSSSSSRSSFRSGGSSRSFGGGGAVRSGGGGGSSRSRR